MRLQVGPQPSREAHPFPWGAAAASGAQDDHYATGRLPNVLDENHVITCAITYWKIRKNARSIREWLERYFAGDKNGANYLSLYTLAVNADEELESWYRTWGIQGVHHALEVSKQLEIALNLIATQHAVALTGDWRMGRELLLV